MAVLPNPQFPQVQGYQLTEKLYRAKLTAVYRGISDANQQNVVIKLLCSDCPSIGELVKFRNQYVVASNLSIPGIVKPLALKPWGNGYALVMEDFGGIALGAYVREQVHDQQLSWQEVLVIALQIATILHELHRARVIHKDIKPANLLIHPETKQIQLIDFSIASLLPKENQELQSPNALEGTLAYIAPEQTGRMNRGVDYRADFYSLGVTLYELLTGQLPFCSDDPMELVHWHIAKVPVAVHEVNAQVPAMLSAIVSKLMAKNAEERYQSALGLKHDLQQCDRQWEALGQIEGFELGQKDLSDRFTIPEKLYGRKTEVKTLLDAFERVAQGSSELMLVAGFSGIGKTAVVNEVHKPITRQKGYFIKGKFDQLNRNIPFSAFVQAFRSLMGQLLGETDVILADWKTKILTAVGDGGQVLIEVIPELERVIGVQPAVPELTGTAAQNRFNLLFGKFVQVFAQPEHPLVVFLDDLQWVDSASLNLLKTLMTESQSGHLLVLGAYRDNEVSPAHSLVLALEELKTQGAWVRTLTLEPLKLSDATQLVSDTLLQNIHRTASLSALIYQETQGNPFFIIQLLQGLYDDGQIHFDIEAGYWHCDLTQLSLNEDVVAFIGTRLRKFPEQTQEVLKVASCVGNQFDLATLAVVCERSQAQLAEDLWPALQLGLVMPESQMYKVFLRKEQPDERLHSSSQPLYLNYCFLHDRVQQAAYSLIPQSKREIVHYQIGQLLSKDQFQESLEEKIFDIVGHFNLCETLIFKQSDRDELAHLNLVAGTRAKKSAAYQASLDYARKGLSLLGKESWERTYQLTLDLHNLATESAYLTGDASVTEQFTSEIKNHARQALDKASSARTQIQMYASQQQYDLAIAAARTILEELGVDLPIAPSFEQVQQEYSQFQPYISQFSFEEIAGLPLLKDNKKLAIAQILLAVGAPAVISDANLFWLVTLQLVRFSLDNGNSPYSAYAYSSYGMLINLIEQDIEGYYQFGQLSLKVVDIFPQNPTKTRVLNVAGAYTSYLKSHLRDARDLCSEAYARCLENGDFEFGGYAIHSRCQNLFCCGETLTVLQTEIVLANQAAARLNHNFAKRLNQLLSQIISKLMAELEEPDDLESKCFSLEEAANSMAEGKDFFCLHHLYLYQSILQYLFYSQDRALLSIQLSKDNLDSVSGWLTEYIFYFYESLICLRHINASSVVEGELEAQYLEKVGKNQEKYKIWADHAPMNFQHKYDLVEAERNRVLGNMVEALELYDQAIAGAKEHQYLQEEALANELAAKFYLDWDKEKVATGYMQEAYYCYARWGARAKTDDLEKRYPQLLQPILQQAIQPSDSLAPLSSIAPVNLSTHSSSSITSTSTGRINQTFDLATVFKLSQVLTENIDLDELLEKLSRMMLQTSGTDHCAIVMPEGQENWQVRAKATLEAINLAPEPLESSLALPIQLIQYVKNTQEIVVLDDVNHNSSLVGSYFHHHQSWSALGAPMLHQGRLIGVLYLQNQSTTGVFTHDRITVINFLCSQAAIALDNAQLYRNLEQRVEERTQALQESQGALAKLNDELEVRVRDRTARLADSEKRFKSLFNQAADAIILVNKDGFIDCNQAALDLFLYPSKADLLALSPHSISPRQQPDGQSSASKFGNMQQEALQRCNFRFEWVYQRSNGENFWAQITLTPIKHKQETIFHSIIRDISDRKAAELALQDSQAQFRHMTENVPGMIYRSILYADGSTKLLYVGSQVREIFEMEPDTVLQNPSQMWARIHPDDLPWLEKQVQTGLQNATALSTVYRLILPEKGLRWVNNKSSVEQLDNGDLIWNGVVIDITDRKAAELALQESQAQFQRMAENVPGMIHRYVLHPDGSEEVIYVDSLVREIFEVEPEAVIQNGELLWDRVHLDDLEGIKNELQISAETLQPLIIEARLLLPQKGLRWVQFSSSPERLDNGDIIWDGVAIDISARKAAELALEKSQAQLRRLAENIPAMIFRYSLSPDGSSKILFVTNRSRDIFELEPEEIIQDNSKFWSMVHPDDIAAVVKKSELSAKDLSPYQDVYRIVMSDGRIKWLEVASRPEHDHNGGIIWDGVCFDITDRKAAEQALQESQDRFQRISENIPGMIYRCILHPDGTDTMTYISSKVREIFELEPEAVLADGGRQMWERTHPDDIARIEADTQASADALQPFENEHRLILPEKGIRWIQASAQPERLDNGDIAWDGMAIDITERKTAESALKKSQSQFRRMTENVPGMIYRYVLHADGSEEYTYVSSQVREIYECEPEAALNDFEQLKQRVHPDDLPKLREKSQASAETLHPYKAECRLTLPQKGLRWMQLISIPERLDNGDVAWDGIVIDITDRKQTEAELQRTNEELRHATRMKDEFLANMSHELRTPLNSVIGFSQLMQQDNTLSDKHKETLHTINRSGEHLLSLINDILEMSKIEAGQITLELELINLPRLLDELQDMLKIKADVKHVSFNFCYASDLPGYIQADGLRLRQILLNLLSNALKFTTQGEVTFWAEVGEPLPTDSEEKIRLRFSVTDTGPGIPVESQTMIFQPFVQASAGQHSRQGTGLGLPISQKFAEMMGGRISVKSIEGQGSIFHCEICVDAFSSDQIPKPAVPQRYQNIRGLKDTQTSYRLLVVDDNPDNRALLSQMLSIPGFELETANNGKEAVAWNEHWQPHLIWMDIRMPVMDGLEAIRQIRRQSGHQPKIIAITANAFVEEREIAMQAGCDDFISKPFAANEVLERLECWLEVEFIYEKEKETKPDNFPKSPSQPKSEKELIQRGFRAMPTDWQLSFQQAIYSLNNEAVSLLLAEVPKEQQAMVDIITELQKDFRYDILVDLVTQIS